MTARRRRSGRAAARRPPAWRRTAHAEERRSIAWCERTASASGGEARDLHREAVEADGPASQDEDGPVPRWA